MMKVSFQMISLRLERHLLLMNGTTYITQQISKRLLFTKGIENRPIQKV